ncbi:zinc finger protein 2 homolog [Dendronephthya gigantea]|uniref:zinc finger protein 2 homolog n=1 Tax=Dendronephthya gigantea TaxID=151771 RepID=UPI00106A8642|nr:zinc finger protein 2 homolog [Dendronephthya gigantea]
MDSKLKPTQSSFSKLAAHDSLIEFSKVVGSNKSSHGQNNGGLSMPPNVQLTVRTGIQNGQKPSLCLCQQTLEDANVNQRKLATINSGIQSKKDSYNEGKESKNGAIDHQKYFEFYFEILAKESSRSSQIECAQCLPDYESKYHDQIDNRQSNDKKDYIEISDDDDDDIMQNDRQINHKEVINGQNFNKQIDSNKSVKLKQIDQQTNENVKGQVLTTEILEEEEEFPLIVSLKQQSEENDLFLCKDCGEAFQQDATFREHQDKKLCKKVVCTFCGQKFVTRDDLEKHKAVIHHKCLECNKLYNSAEKLMLHNRRHHSAPRQQNVNRQKSIKKIQIKLKTVANVEEQVKPTEIQEPKAIARHSSVLSTCGICLKEFPTVLSLEKHCKENGHFLCKECGEAFQEDATFREHQDKKLCKNVVCTFCGQKFVTRDELENHKAIIHHKCLQCNKLYNSAEKLRLHNKRHHNPPYTCLQCGQEFPTHSACKTHALTKHQKRKFCCPECGKSFTRMAILNRHATYTHSEQRNFQCEICSKTFKRPDALKIHMISHSDNKPFHCEKCGKQFNQKICYTKHLPCRKGKGRSQVKKVASKTALEDHVIRDKEMFESTTSLESSVDEEIINMGCHCPPSCSCKTFSIGLKVQETEPRGPSLNGSKEIASLPCCCNENVELPSLPMETLTSAT